MTEDSSDLRNTPETESLVTRFLRSRKGRIAALGMAAILLTVSVSTGVVVADGDEEFPEGIQPIECPDLSDVPLNESLTFSDYSDCFREDQTRSIQRQFWSDIQTVRGIANWMTTEGESMQNRDLPVVTPIGQRLEGLGHTLFDKAKDWENQILNY